MAVTLTAEEQAIAGGRDGPGRGMALRILAESARLLGAERLIPIASSHIDGCLYHGDSGVVFAEKLVEGGAGVTVPTTLNVGALDLLRPQQVRLDSHQRDMALRLMRAHEALGCRATWTCAPYQAGHRPARGEDVAWGESNAVAFVNSILGARSNRYGDFLDLCCAITGRAPATGLHLPENRRAAFLVDTSAIPEKLKKLDAFYPVLGTWYGRAAGEAIGVIDGLPQAISEDSLKAFGAAAASSGSVALFHAAGLTPEAPDSETALGGQPPAEVLRPTAADLLAARDSLSTVDGTDLDAIAVGSPHFSHSEFKQLLLLLDGRRSQVPFHACTGRHVIEQLEDEDLLQDLERAGINIVADTCVVVTPILEGFSGVLMTNSGKFAHYAPGNTGYGVLYGSLSDCVESAVAGRVVRDESLWSA